MVNSAPLQSVTVFCGSRAGTENRYAAAARRLGRLLADDGIRLVYGGGHVGLMGILADAVLEAGGEVVGIMPSFLEQREIAHRGLTELVVVDSMHERKIRMFELSDAFVSLPGGVGTLDETVELLTWKQLGLHQKPILLLNEGGYWTPFLDLLNRFAQRGFGDSKLPELFTVVDEASWIIPTLRKASR